MCIAILAPPGKQLSYEHAKTSIASNLDGIGYAFNVDGVVVLRKAFFSLGSFWKNYWLDSRRFKSSTFMIHFRTATSGSKDVVNTHPFRINPNLVFSHNGIINLTHSDKTKSDTYALMTILKDLPSDFYMNKNILTLLSLSIGWSKLVFLDGQGKWSFVNEDRGFWDNGIWYSNGNYKSYTYNGYWDTKTCKWVKTYDTDDSKKSKDNTHTEDKDTKDTSTATTNTSITKPTLNGYTQTREGVWVRTRESSIEKPLERCKICKTILFENEKIVCTFCRAQDVCAVCGVGLMQSEVSSGTCIFCRGQVE